MADIPETSGRTQETDMGGKFRLGSVTDIIKGDGRFSEIIRFGITGAIATAIQYGLYVVFVDVVNLPATVSTVISYLLSFVCNFFLSSYFTFRSKPNTKKGLGFACSHLVNMGLQVGLVAVFQLLVGKTLALLPAMAICIPINYLLVRFVFSSRYFK